MMVDYMITLVGVKDSQEYGTNEMFRWLDSRDVATIPTISLTRLVRAWKV